MCIFGGGSAPPEPKTITAPPPTPAPPVLEQAAPAKAARAKQKARLTDPYGSGDGGARALRIRRPSNAKVSMPSVNTGGSGMGVNANRAK